MTRLLTALLAALWASLAVLVAPAAATAVTATPAAATAATAAPDCDAISVEDSSKAARAVFSGTVTAVARQPRTDGQQGAYYLHTVQVSRVYRGRITSESVQVQTDRNLAQCSLGELATGTEYMFFVNGNGAPWLANGGGGTRPADEVTVATVEQLLGEGKPPVEPKPEQAQYTAVDTGEPQSLSRSAAPGGALVIVGLLGLVVVRGFRRRTT